MSVSRYTLSLASKINKSLLADYQAWQDECEADRARGHRPSHCEHGTYLWQDWDVICGPCEDSMTMSDGVIRMAYALDSAKARVEKVGKITQSLADLSDLGVHFTPEQMDPVYVKINDLLTVR